MLGNVLEAGGIHRGTVGTVLSNYLREQGKNVKFTKEKGQNWGI